MKPKSNPTHPVRIKLKRNHSLSVFGYSLDADSWDRKRALTPAVRAYGPGYVIKKLNVLYIFRKNKDVVRGRRARADMRWVHDMFL